MALIPTIITAAAIPFMSDKVPMHYDVSGNVDRYGSKYENFIFPFSIIAITIFWLILYGIITRKVLAMLAWASI